MRKFLLLLILLLTYYISGMYQTPALLALCGAELVMMAALLILPRCLRRRVQAVFVQRTSEAVRGGEALCALEVRNRGPFPAGRVELRIQAGYPGDKKKRVRVKLYGGADLGTSRMEFRLRAPYCGLILVRLERVRFFDYLSLFSASRRTREEMQVAVFPSDLALRVVLDAGGYADGQASHTAARPGDAGGEILKIREYQPGDPVRRIHWNQSARTSQMWIKEYEQESTPRFRILPDGGAASVPMADACYRLLSALILGLLAADAEAEVYAGGVGMPVRTAEECREALFRLYRMERGGTDTADADRPVLSGIRTLRLTADLCIREGETLLARFSPDRLDQEIRAAALTL